MSKSYCKIKIKIEKLIHYGNDFLKIRNANYNRDCTDDIRVE